MTTYDCESCEDRSCWLCVWGPAEIATQRANARIALAHSAESWARNAIYEVRQAYVAHALERFDATEGAAFEWWDHSREWPRWWSVVGDALEEEVLEDA